MLTNIPRPKPRDAVDSGDVKNIHEKIQVGMFRDMTQHTLWSKDVLVVNAFTHTYTRSEEHTSELQSRENLVCRLLLEKKKKKKKKKKNMRVKTKQIYNKTRNH